MRVAALAAAMTLAAACAGSSAGRETGAVAAPAPVDAAAAVAAAMRADDALRSAYAQVDDRSLVGLFAAPLLAATRRDLAALAARGAHREERLQSRRVVHLAVRARDAEVVLALLVGQRLVVGAANPPFVNVLRQWRVELRHGPSGWQVEDAADLRPEQWWPDLPAASSPAAQAPFR